MEWINYELGRRLPLLPNNVVLVGEVATSHATGQAENSTIKAAGDLVDDIKKSGLNLSGGGKANTRRMQGIQMFEYPISSDINAQGHYIIFQIHKHEPGSLSIGTDGAVGDTNVITPPEKGYFRRRSFQLRNKSKRTETQIALYMPPSVKVSYKSNYEGDTEIGQIAEAGANAIGNLISGGLGGANIVDTAAQAAGQALPALRQAATDFSDKFVTGTRALADIISGSIISSKMELMFKGVGRRSFSYDFNFIPKSELEAQMVDQIIFEFKRAMLPNYGSSGNLGSIELSSDRLLTIPTTFDIKYFYTGGDNMGVSENSFLNRISTCFCTDVSVSYGGSRYTAYRPTVTRRNVSSEAGGSETEFGPGNGSGPPPQKTQLTLHFTELEIMTQESIDMGF